MYTTFAFLDLSTPDLLIILAIVLLIFGGRKLPELSKSLGQSIKELRSGMSDDSAAAPRPTADQQAKKTP
jgi:sec-independent protein translocase protein TatA